MRYDCCWVEGGTRFVSLIYPLAVGENSPPHSPNLQRVEVRVAGMLLLLAGVSARLVHPFPEQGMRGGWQESAPSTHAERLANFAFSAVQGSVQLSSDSRTHLLGAEIVELTSYRTQVLAA